MMDERKPRTLWPYVIAVLIGLPVLDVLSFGPACWLESRFGGAASCRYATPTTAGKSVVAATRNGATAPVDQSSLYGNYETSGD